MLRQPIVALCAALTFASLIVFKGDPTLMTLSVVVLGVVILWVSWSIEHLIVYVTLLLLAIVTEILSVREGLWMYPSSGVYGVPLWIPFVWSNSALVVIELKEVIDSYMARKRK